MYMIPQKQLTLTDIFENCTEIYEFDKPELSRKIDGQTFGVIITWRTGWFLERIEALENGTIAGAGLDVQETEPPEDNSPLYTMDKNSVQNQKVF